MQKIDFIKEQVPFTQVANHVLVDPELSSGAKCMYAYLYSKPDGWNFNYIRISKEFKESKNTVLKYIRELENYGLLTRRRMENGRMNYQVHIKPVTKNRSESKKPLTKDWSDQNLVRPKSGQISNKEYKVIKSINNKEVAETSSAPFNLKKYIQDCYEHKSKLIQLIGLYMDYRYDSLYKKIKTSEQAQAVVKRHLKYAKELQRWSDEQINQGMAEVNKKNSDIDWTLETLFKHLTK